MGFYGDWFLPRLLNVAMDTKVPAEQRRLALHDVKGTVLEIGFGTGHNLPHYPEGIERLVAVDPSAASAKLALQRIAASHFPVEYRKLTGERLDAPDETFDAVVSTFTLCTVPDPVATLEHVRRVGERSVVGEDGGEGKSGDSRRWPCEWEARTGVSMGKTGQGTEGGARRAHRFRRARPVDSSSVI